MGSITCVGVGTEALWNSTLSGKSGIERGIGRIDNDIVLKLQNSISLKTIPSRAVVLALTSIKEAMLQAGWNGLDDDDGLIIATTTGQIGVWETKLTDFIQKKIEASEFQQAWENQTLGSITACLVKHLEFKGKTLLLSSACSAATQALALAKLWIDQGRVKRCLVGGVETLSELTLEGFKSLRLLSSEPAKPFDENRVGINLSEGSAFLCLEKNAPVPLADLSGFGMSSDVYHMTAPHPEGNGSFTSMQKALTKAGLAPGDINWIHAHGTGSKANDQAEGIAIMRLFGIPEQNKNVPWVSSTKGVHGHTLGASGAVEAVLCVKSIECQTVLPTLGLKKSDPSLLLRHPEAPVKCQVRHILKNTLGFGGSNASLIFSLPTEFRAPA